MDGLIDDGDPLVRLALEIRIDLARADTLTAREAEELELKCRKVADGLLSIATGLGRLAEIKHRTDAFIQRNGIRLAEEAS